MVREVSILNRDATEASRRRGHLSCPPQSCPESLKPLPTPDRLPGPEAQVPAERSQPGPHDFFDCSRCEGRSKPSAPGDTRGSLSRPAATLGQAGWILSGDVRNSGCDRARPPRQQRAWGEDAVETKRRGAALTCPARRSRASAAGRRPPRAAEPTAAGRAARQPRGARRPGAAPCSPPARPRTRGPESLVVSRRQPRPAPRPAPPRPASALPQPNKGQPVRAEQGTLGRRAEEQSPGWPHSWDQGQMEGLVNGSVRMESQSPTVRARKESGLDIPTI